MNLSRYLPTRQFSLIALSLLLSGGLVFAADRVTNPTNTAHLVSDSRENQGDAQYIDGDWQAALNAVQAESGISLPEAPDQTTIQGLLQAAQNGNVTDTVSRSVLVSLVNAKGQGLGDDTPTQNQIINSALKQLNDSKKIVYTQGDVAVVNANSASLKEYGNKLAILLVKHGMNHNDYAATIVAVDNAASSDTAEPFKNFPDIQARYEQLAEAIIALPVPQTLSPFHLQLANDFAQIAATYPQMQKLISDPIAGLAGAQQYNSLTAESARVFINIAQTLNKNDILFGKDEPGALWPFLLQQQNQ